jgi:RimJ/RimL family protein N-acetyltransferase
MNFERPENQDQIRVSQINPEDLQEVIDYYQFEIDQDFSKVPEQSTLEKMGKFRQKQMMDNKPRVAKAVEDNKIVGTSVVVLENGAMGKKIKDDEAWAAGTVINKERRGQGIGEKLSVEQDKIARAAGKKSLVTTIVNDNFPSMRLRLKVGYELEGLDRRENETGYLYRKDLIVDQTGGKDWAGEVESGNLKLFSAADQEQLKNNQDLANQILVDPADDQTVERLLTLGYRGRYLLRPEDFKNEKLIDRNLLVFSKGEDHSAQEVVHEAALKAEQEKSAEQDQAELKKIREDLNVGY